VPFISLVNLIHGKKLVPELIQDDCNSIKMLANLYEILKPDASVMIREGYKQISDQLTSGGGPSEAASDIIADLHHSIGKNGQV